MNLSWKTWLGAGLMAPVVAIGCNSTQKHQDGGCPTCGGGGAYTSAMPAAPTPGGQYMANAVTTPTPYAPMASYKVPEVSHEMAAPPMAAPRAMPARVVSSAPTRATTVSVAPYTGTGYHHSPDYSTLVGELIHNPRQNTWRLRFAPVDEEDRYGGSVTLQNVGREMADFKPGQHVRVEGAIVNPNAREVSPAYHVRDILPAGSQP